ELTRLASIDPLTGLRNRQSLEADLAQLHATCARHGRRYSLAMCDVDHFKSYNDSQGHLAGDDALRSIGSTLALVARRSDSVYRYGGEEFLIVLSEEHPDGAFAGAERLRRSISDLALPHPASQERVITLSVGIAGYDPARPSTGREVLESADAALYQAKAEGRNRVVSSCPDPG
ncbi:MAG: GGDEF domain-containing protein, partial [Acidimicrobiales bacterium]